MIHPKEFLCAMTIASMSVSMVSAADANWWKIERAGDGCSSVEWAASKNRLSLTLPRGISEMEKVRVRFKFPNPDKKIQSVEFLPGNGEPPLRLSTAADGESLRCGSNIGDYHFNGGAMRSFSWPDKLLGWSNYHARKQRVPLKDRVFTLELARAEKGWSVSVDGIFLQTWTDVPRLEARRSAESVEISAPESQVEKTPGRRLFETVDISRRTNSSSVGGEKISASSLPAPGSVVSVDGVPFRMPEKSDNDNIDVGISWVREGNLPGAHPGDRGTFGGRWAGALSINPTRIQFRVPNRQYNAVHLIAASEDASEKVPSLTAQFYRAKSGFPKSFTLENVPSFAAEKATARRLGVVTEDGKKRALWLLRIDIDPDQLQEFSNLDHMEMELTKRVSPYRGYPDPAYYSEHGAGLPSGVHVYAMTLGVRPVTVEFSPESFANVFTEDKRPLYHARLENLTAKERKIDMRLELRSFDGTDVVSEERSLILRGGERKEASFSPSPKLNGWYSAVLKADNGEFRRSLVCLAKRDDRGVFKDFGSDGHIFGTWPSGAHGTPSVDQGLKIMAMAGAKSSVASLTPNDRCENTDSGHKREMAEVMREFGVRSYTYFGFVDFRYAGFDFPRPDFNVTFDNSQKEKMRDALSKKLKELAQAPSDISQPRVVRIFGEPGGIGVEQTFAKYCGEKPRDLTENEAKRFETYCQKLKVAGELLRKEYPDAKILMPHGDPLFAIPFLEKPELAGLVDGVAVDYALFDRIPEMQLHQCAPHRIWMFLDAWKKSKKAEPTLAMFEGPALGPITKGSLSAREDAALMTRAALLLSGYGIRMQFTTGCAVAPASWYGEQHYSSGMIGRPGGLNPNPSYAAFAAMTRQLADVNFEKWLPTGSLSSFCYQFINPATKERTHALWLVRGARKASFDRDVRVFDAMDNERALKKGETVTVSDLPIFVRGAGDSPQITWGEPDHSDSKLGQFNIKLGNMADKGWRQVREKEELYTESNPDHVKRFPAEMETSVVAEPQKALSVSLGNQGVDRGVMPYFTAFKPENPIPIPGRASHISALVKGSSDWGRIVYVLRDAAGKKWVSVGSKGAWNCDDTQARSVFCFDGWRLLKFELPSHSPYDNYRENGTTWWGTDNENAVVKLPLALEKVVIERRSKAMYANDLVPCPAAPVLVGDIFAEYASGEDMGDEAVRLSRVEMPEPPAIAAENPIADLSATATLPPTRMLSVEQPSVHYDGTNGVFSFETAKDAKSYDIYLSRHPDGRDAIRLGSKIKASPAPVKGFLAGTDFYVFVVYQDEKGAHSKPSEGFKFNLPDLFGMK